MAYHCSHGLNTKIIRIFNTYGPRMRMDDGRAIPTFLTQALRNEDLTVFGDGSQTRSFCYVDDLVEGLARLMNSPAEVTGPINLGNPVEFTMAELAELVLKITGARSEITHEPLPSDDPTRRCPDITLARQTLDWEPRTPLAEGLEKTIAYFDELLTRSRD